MAFIKDYYTESGQHFIQVTPQEKGWIPYQAAMICVQKPEWLPPCERLTEQEGILYNVTDCICIQSYSVMDIKELTKVIQACTRVGSEAQELLLDPGCLQSELRYIYWDTKAERLQCIYVPQEPVIEIRLWLTRVSGHLLSHAVAKRWPEEGVLQCSRMYCRIADEDEETDSPEEAGEQKVQEREEESPAKSMVQYQAEQARYARYALWDDMAEEEDSEKEPTQKMRERMRQFFGKKEK